MTMRLQPAVSCDLNGDRENGRQRNHGQRCRKRQRRDGTLADRELRLQASSTASISRPSQVTGWPIARNKRSGQPSTASIAIATAIAPANSTTDLPPATVMRKKPAARKPNSLRFRFVFAGK